MHGLAEQPASPLQLQVGSVLAAGICWEPPPAPGGLSAASGCEAVLCRAAGCDGHTANEAPASLLPGSLTCFLEIRRRKRCPVVNSRPFCRRSWCLQAAVLLAAAQCPALPTQISQVGCFTTNLEERENVFLSISYMLSVQL